MSNANIDRFDSYIVDDAEECANCSASRPYSNMVYDEYTNHYVCDRECFDEWADSNREEVDGFYYEINCG